MLKFQTIIAMQSLCKAKLLKIFEIYTSTLGCYMTKMCKIIYKHIENCQRIGIPLSKGKILLEKWHFLIWKWQTHLAIVRKLVVKGGLEYLRKLEIQEVESLDFKIFGWSLKMPKISMEISFAKKCKSFFRLKYLEWMVNI